MPIFGKRMPLHSHVFENGCPLMPSNGKNGCPRLKNLVNNRSPAPMPGHPFSNSWTTMPLNWPSRICIRKGCIVKAVSGEESKDGHTTARSTDECGETPPLMGVRNSKGACAFHRLGAIRVAPQRPLKPLRPSASHQQQTTLPTASPPGPASGRQSSSPANQPSGGPEAGRQMAKHTSVIF